MKNKILKKCVCLPQNARIELIFNNHCGPSAQKYNALAVGYFEAHEFHMSFRIHFVHFANIPLIKSTQNLFISFFAFFIAFIACIPNALLRFSIVST